MSFEIANICRTCLGLDGILLSIYDSKGSNGSGCVADMLRDLTNVEAKKADGLPEKVCLACISEINRCFSFKMKCDNSDKTLRQLLDIPINPQPVETQKVETEEQIKPPAETKPIPKVLNEEIKKTHKRKLLEETPQEQFIKEAPSSSAVDGNLILSVHTEEDIGTTSYFSVQSQDNEEIEVDEDKNREIQEVDENSGQYSIIFTKYINETEAEEAQMIEEEEEQEEEPPQQEAPPHPLTIERSSKQKKGESKCSMCPMSFVHPRNLMKHMIKIHNVSESILAEHTLQDTIKAFVIQNTEKEDNVDPNEEEELESLQEETENDEEDYVMQTIEEIEECFVKQEPEAVSKNLETQVNELRCPRCRARFAILSSLNIHIQQNKCTKPQFSCPDCQKVFISRESLKEHRKTHKLTCEICSENLASKEDLAKHTAAHRGVSTKYQCPYCKKVFTMNSTLKDHMRIHTGEKPFVCDLCGKAFNQNANLKQHVMRHNNTKPHKCDQCHRSFVSKGELYAHLRSHTGDQPFRCDTCTSAFTTSSSLAKHKRIHTGERPYSCDFCPMRFTALNTLKNHRRTHTGEKPYKCKFCQRAFAQKSDCSIHMRTHTGERRYTCSICDSKFQQCGTLRTHMKTHNKDPVPKAKSQVEKRQASLEFNVIAEVEDDQDMQDVQEEGGQDTKRQTIADSEEVIEIGEDELLHFNIEECGSGNSNYSGE